MNETYDFKFFLKAILFWEGGLTDDEFDPGGKTKWGLSHKFLKTIGINDVESVNVHQMRIIYEIHFWDKCKCGRLPPYLALVVFDSAVNQGTGRATKFLQKALKVKVDGIIGNKTIAATRTARPNVLLRNFMTLRAMHYSSLLNLLRYRKGWFRRLFDMHYRSVLIIKNPSSSE